MNHLGDITKIRGCAIPAVDCVIGGILVIPNSE